MSIKRLQILDYLKNILNLSQCSVAQLENVERKFLFCKINSASNNPSGDRRKYWS